MIIIQNSKIFIVIKKLKTKIKFSCNLFSDNYEIENKKIENEFISKLKQKLINEQKILKDTKNWDKLSSSFKKENKKKKKKIDNQYDIKKKKI